MCTMCLLCQGLSKDWLLDSAFWLKQIILGCDVSPWSGGDTAVSASTADAVARFIRQGTSLVSPKFGSSVLKPYLKIETQMQISSKDSSVITADFHISGFRFRSEQWRVIKREQDGN